MTNDIVDKSLFRDEGGRFLTQSLFLEHQYKPDVAVFTFDEFDKEYKGKRFISLKRVYLEFEDPQEYLFAKTYLYNWEHWQRMCENKAIRYHIDKWRGELELQLASTGVQRAIEMASDGNFQAAKWITTRGWESRAGRPSKKDIERDAKRAEHINREFEDDLKRMEDSGVIELDAKRK